VDVTIAQLEGLARLTLNELSTIGQRAFGTCHSRCDLGPQAPQLRVCRITDAVNEIFNVGDQVVNLLAGCSTGLLSRIPRRATQTARVALEFPCCRFHRFAPKKVV
jgi:hypothetical protein